MVKEKDSTEKIKVVIGANDLRLAGVQRLVIDQLVLLDREVFDVNLIVLMKFPGKKTFDYLIPDDVSVHQLYFSGFLDIGEWINLFKTLRGIKPDVVKTATFFSNTIFLLFKFLFGYEVVSAEHNTVNKKPLWQRIVDRILLPRSFSIVGDSKEVVKFVSSVENIREEKFTVIYNGVDLDEISSSISKYSGQKHKIKDELQIPQDSFVVFNAARLVRQKNHKLTIEAFAELYSRHNNAYLIIAGDGGLLGELKDLVKTLEIEERVRFVGEVKDLHKIYMISDVFIVTSTREGFCIVAMEALAFGVPVVSTRVAGISEYLRDGVNGFFSEYNAGDVADKLEKVYLLDEREESSFAEAGKETARGYSKKRYGLEMNKLLKESVA